MNDAILLDTHMLLWLRASPERLTDGERGAIDGAALRFVSAATFWEIGILLGLGRIEHDARLFTVPEGLDLLPVRPEHCREVASLPPIHRDPFDRMLIAQARVDGLTLLTRDGKIAEYGRAGATAVMLGPPLR